MHNGGIANPNGQSHQECNQQTGCGIEFWVDGKRWELEAGELVLCPGAAQSQHKHRIKGVPAQIISKLNEKYCGKVYIDGGEITDVPDHNIDINNIAVVDALEPHNLVINKKNSLCTTVFELEGTPRQIASYLNEYQGNGNSFRNDEKTATVISVLEKGGEINNNTQYEEIISAGFAIFYNDKIFLIHPTEAPWYKTYSIPKGQIEHGESEITAAIREAKEETGITIPSRLITPKTTDFKSLSDQRKKGLRRTITAFPLRINKLSDIGLPELPESKTGIIALPKEMLQLKEVDWAGFMTIREAKKRVHDQQWHFLFIHEFNPLKND